MNPCQITDEDKTLEESSLIYTEKGEKIDGWGWSDEVESSRAGNKHWIRETEDNDSSILTQVNS
jgi:hypothetical protein